MTKIVVMQTERLTAAGGGQGAARRYFGSMTSLESPHSTPDLAVPATPLATPLATRIVDLGAIARNIARIRDITATPILAVVKAD